MTVILLQPHAPGDGEKQDAHLEVVLPVPVLRVGGSRAWGMSTREQMGNWSMGFSSTSFFPGICSFDALSPEHLVLVHPAQPIPCCEGMTSMEPKEELAHSMHKPPPNPAQSKHGDKPSCSMCLCRSLTFHFPKKPPL